MIFVKVSLWPDGDSSRAVTIAGAMIANVSELADVSDYACTIRAEGHDELGIPPSVEAVLIKRHERKAGVLELLRRVFAAACKRPGDLSDFGPKGYSMILTEDIDALRIERDALLALFDGEHSGELHLNILRHGALSREHALHIAGATDYDALKANIGLGQEIYEAALAGEKAENRRLQDQLYALTLETGKKFARLQWASAQGELLHDKLERAFNKTRLTKEVQLSLDVEEVQWLLARLAKKDPG